MSTNKATSMLKLRDESNLHKTIDYESNASVNLASGQSDQARIPTFPFLRLPAELRIQVYRYLLHTRDSICIYTSDAPKRRLRHRPQVNHLTESQKSYGDTVTYRVTAIGLYPAILAVSRQTYLEAIGVLYSENRFNFHVKDDPPLFITANPAVIPFLEDRSEGSRRLIKEIDIEYAFDISSLDLWRDSADQIYGFERSCDYLGQNLQLEHVTLVCACFVDLCLRHVRSDAPNKNYRSNLDKQSWVQHLVPLVRMLKSFTVMVWAGIDLDMARAVQIYLESKLSKTSKTICQSQIKRELTAD